MVDRSPLVDQYLPPRQRTTASTTTTAPALSAQQPAPAVAESQGESKLNRKQQLIQQNIELRKKFETMVLQWQEVLLDPVTEETLGEAVSIYIFLLFLHHSRKQGPTVSMSAAMEEPSLAYMTYMTEVISVSLLPVLSSIGEPHQTVSLQGDPRGEEHRQALRIPAVRQTSKGMACCSPSYGPYLCSCQGPIHQREKKEALTTDYFIRTPFTTK